jgi:hypothetical protein
MLKIDISPLQAFGITMNMALTYGTINAFTNCKTNFFTLDETLETEDARIFLIEYRYTIDSISDEFKLQSLLAHKFTVRPLSEITPKAIYGCVSHCKDEMQSYFDKIFSNLKVKPDAKIETFEALEPHIMSMIEGFYR